MNMDSESQDGILNPRIPAKFFKLNPLGFRNYPGTGIPSNMVPASKVLQNFKPLSKFQ